MLHCILPSSHLINRLTAAVWFVSLSLISASPLLTNCCLFECLSACQPVCLVSILPPPILFCLSVCLPSSPFCSLASSSLPKLFLEIHLLNWHFGRKTSPTNEEHFSIKDLPCLLVMWDAVQYTLQQYSSKPQTVLGYKTRYWMIPDIVMFTSCPTHERPVFPARYSV